MAGALGHYIAAFGGLFLLALSSDCLVRGSLSFSERFGLSPLLAGIFLVGFGTSLPELSVSLGAALDHQPGMAIGNLIGSNIANVWLVLAGVALLFTVTPGHFGQRRSVLVLLLATAAWISLAALDLFTPIVGIALLILLAVYIFIIAAQTHLAHDRGEDVGFRTDHPERMTWFMTLALTVCGLIGLPISAYLVVDGGVEIARNFNISEEFIGLTLLAVGTSLPELAVSLMAAMRRQGDVVIGSVLGSNLFNLMGIGGLISLFGGLSFAPVFENYDHWFLGAATITLALFILPKAKVTRLAGLAMLLAYALYLYGLVNGWNLLALLQSVL